jgi:hypothetical protein
MKITHCFPSGKILLKIAGLALAIGLGGAVAARADTGTPKAKADKPAITEKAAEESAEYVNVIMPGATFAEIDGNASEFQRRTGIPRSFSGGIEELILEQKLDKDTTFSVEGHGLYRAYDFDIKLRAERAGVGHIESGYESFRTWYNGGGGYYPQNGLYLSLYDTNLHVDRGEAWFEAVLDMPDIPKLTFKYTHEFRRGKKDSIEWGESNRTPLGAIYIVPAFRQFDEINDIFEGKLEHTIDNTKIESELRYELGDEKSAHYLRRQPGEARTAAVLGDHFFSQHEQLTFDLFNYRNSTETWFTDKLMFASGYSYSTVNTHVGGDLIPAWAYDAPYTAAGAVGANMPVYFGQEGGAQWNQHIVNLNLLFVPAEDWTLTTAFRAEREGSDSRTSQWETTQTTLASNVSLTNERSASFWLKLAQQMEATYKGIRDWVFYFRADWEESGNDYSENRQTNIGVPGVANATVNRISHEDVWRQKYLLGANWYASRSVNTSVQYYHRVRQNDYVNWDDSSLNYLMSGDRYPAFLTSQKYTTDDMDCRLTWRLANNLTSVTRYDFQLGSIETTADYLGSVKTGESTAHVIGETLTWSPLTALSLQGGVNYVMDKTWTPANSTLASVGNNLASMVTTSQNNYWNANFSAMYALTTKTDLTAGYYYYRADNYRPDVAALPYDSGAEEHQASLGVVHRFADNVSWTVRYGYYVNHDALSGGYNNYTAHVVNTGVQIQF